MRFVDLFCGIGGFRLGLERANRTDFIKSHKGQHKKTKAQSNGGLDVGSNRFKAGYRCVWSCDIDKYARRIYEKNFSEEPEGDITKISAESIPNHDLLCAGFPCQSFSVAGRRKGFADTRGTLFFDICRILRAKRPSYCLLENVKGLLSHDNGETFKVILESLDELGYGIKWQVLNSKHFGVPQNWERVFIVGYLRGKRRPEVFPITKIHQNDFQGNGEESWGEVGATLSRKSAGGGNARGNYVIHNKRQAGEVRIQKEPCVTKHYGTGGGNVPMVLYGKSQDQKLSHTNRVSQTLNAGHFNQPKIREDTSIRRLTPIECERLQGFPDNWTQGVSDTQRYKLLGNAVTVNVIEFLGKRLAQEVLL